jgi:hypothetical protein
MTSACYAKTKLEKGQLLQQMVLGKQYPYVEIQESRLRSLILHKNLLKMDQRSETLKPLGGNTHKTFKLLA